MCKHDIEKVEADMKATNEKNDKYLVDLRSQLDQRLVCQ